jgi:type I restriction enzyme S subunit
MVNKSNFEKLPFLLPPLQEQNRIVEKLDNMFNQLETIKASMANIPLLLKDFRQQVLTHAVTGKLTSEWRKGKKLEPINIKLDVNNDYQLHTLPEGWNHALISNISKVKGGKRLPKGEELTNENTGYPYIRARDLKQGTVLTENLMYLEEKIQALIKNYIVKEGDLYITIVGAKIGDAGIIPKEVNGANLTENAVKITDLNDNVFNKYFSIWLRCPICQSNIQKTIMSAAQGKLALTRINLLPIYLPSLKEQHEIVSEVESLFTKADCIEKEYKNLREKIDSLPQALLHKAFKGELSEQLESDGDAKELLKAIADLKNIKVTKPKTYKVPKEKLRLVAEPKN